MVSHAWRLTACPRFVESIAIATPQTVTIASNKLRAEISTLGAELQRLTTSDGCDLQWDGSPAVWRGRAPILFPVIGLLEGGEYRFDGKTYQMPKHGFARDSTFDIVTTSADRVTLRLAASEETRAIYPFEFQLDLTFMLAGDGLTISAAITNGSAGSMPASFGFHPAFRWPLPFGQPRASHRILFDQDEPAPIRRIDPQGFLTPTRHPTPIVDRVLELNDDLFVDDALIFDRVESRLVQYGAPSGPQIMVDFADFSTLGVWTKPGAGFICIEPWSGISEPEGFAGDIRDKPGIFEVAPGETRALRMSITLSG